MNITYTRLNSTNFTLFSLDSFVRHQIVNECWRKRGNKWQLVPLSFVEDWSVEEKREIAKDIVDHMEKDQSAFGAFASNELIGFITLSHNFFGTTSKYAEIVCFQVSEPYRGKGIGRKLFNIAKDEATKIGAEKLYISSHSSKESQSTYKSLGCTIAKEINESLAREEPFDIQLEYSLLLRYITLRDEPELKETAADFFHQKWGVKKELYISAMSDYIERKNEYGWFLCLDSNRIVGGLGIIENDFHTRSDLSPNICAVYTIKEYRGRGIAGVLLKKAVEDLREKNISPVYLLTDHIGFYERYGWEFLCMVKNKYEDKLSRMYIHR